MAIAILDHLEGSPTFGFSKNAGTAQDIVRIAWADIDEFGRQLFGIRWPGGGGTGDIATFPGRSWLYVDSMAVEPFDPGNPDGNAASPTGDLNTYDGGARVTIGYKTLEASGDSTSGKTISLSIGAETISIPGSGLQWVSGGQKATDKMSAAIRSPTIGHSYKYKNQSSVPYALIRATIGKVNIATWRDAPAECALFTGCEITEFRSPQGPLLYDVDYKIQEKAISWNKFWRQDTGQFENAVVIGSGAKPYLTASFTGIGD